MRWRYFNQRILLHRPNLLSYAVRRIPALALQAYECDAIEKCRQLAQETIEDIASFSLINQITGWNGVWLIFQAACVPLLRAFLNDSTNQCLCGTLQSCQMQLVVDYLARMQEWSPAATRTLHVVSRILNASKQISRDKSPISPAAADEVGEYSSQLNALENARSNAAILNTPKIPLDQVSLQQSMMK